MYTRRENLKLDGCSHKDLICEGSLFHTRLRFMELFCMAASTKVAHAWPLKLVNANVYMPTKTILTFKPMQV